MSDDPVTLGELRRTVDQVRLELSHARTEVGALAGMPGQLTSMSALWTEQLRAHKEQSAAALAHLSDEVETLKGWQTWALRIVVAAVVLAVVGLVLASPAPR